MKALTDNTTGQRSLFLDSHFFLDLNFTILTCVRSHDICIIFFLFVNIYFANLESYFFTAFDVFYKFQLMYYVFNTFLPSV